MWDQLTDPQVVVRNITSLEGFLGKFNDIRSSSRAVIGTAFDTSDLQLVQSIRDHLVLGNERLDSVKKQQSLSLALDNENEARERELAEEHKIQDAKRAEEEKIVNMLHCADTLVFEINTRYDTFRKNVPFRFLS